MPTLIQLLCFCETGNKDIGDYLGRRPLSEQIVPVTSNLFFSLADKIFKYTIDGSSRDGKVSDWFIHSHANGTFMI